jgi:hypothetical protein
VSHPREELRHRVEARKKELEARLERAKADTHARVEESQREIQDLLEEVENTLSHGWASITDAVAERLNRWLERSGQGS